MWAHLPVAQECQLMAGPGDSASSPASHVLLSTVSIAQVNHETTSWFQFFDFGSDHPTFSQEVPGKTL